MPESTCIEKPCVDIAEAAGWMARKLDVGPGGKGWLDQLFLGPTGTHFIAEFKMPNGKVSELQAKKVKRLKERGHRVYVVDSVALFRRIMLQELAIARDFASPPFDPDPPPAA